MKKATQSLFDQKYRVVLHVILWLSAVVIPLFVVPFYIHLDEHDFWLILPSKLICNALTAVFFYTNYYIFTPNWITTKQSSRFIVIIVAFLLVLIAIDTAYFQFFLKPVLHQHLLRGPRTGRLFDIGKYLTPLPKLAGIVFYFSLALVVSSALAISQYQKRQQENQQEIEVAKLTAELEVLKLQISPHFLFNTLNNIRSLVRKKSDNTEEAIIKLASMLRYMLYASKTDKVPLQKEIDHLNDFITLQKLRLSNPGSVLFRVVGNVEGVEIEPLLFIPFVENAFKYGIHAKKPSAIQFSLTTLLNEIHFDSQNHLFTDITDTDETSGIGLDNVRKRLQLHYPGQHELMISEIDGLFMVKMKIRLSLQG
ncbi:hypothetical protein GO730_17900 [Spirosoma sp. HMF3257]|uniref:Signal transduction histidine kinase internal region domain-containing protein n=1 Tax=Spirosoma telluris TaxID=2183553 RepID=A0A327NMF1_9BACT|nr:hypothetical protein [Spirosoma telluris]RAI75559.1 hypothetical protein HMF3257_17820 [Spirosoma telluris]